MSIWYAFIAKDHETILTEYFYDQSMPKSAANVDKLIKQSVNILNNSIILPKNPKYTLYTSHEIFIFGWICESTIYRDKAIRFLNEIKYEFKAVYTTPFKKSTLTSMSLNDSFKNSWEKILNNYDTGINQNKVNLAFEQLDQV